MLGVSPGQACGRTVQRASDRRCFSSRSACCAAYSGCGFKDLTLLVIWGLLSIKGTVQDWEPVSVAAEFLLEREDGEGEDARQASCS